MKKMKDSGIEWIGEIPEDWEVQNESNDRFFMNLFGDETKMKFVMDKMSDVILMS